MCALESTSEPRATLRARASVAPLFLSPQSTCVVLRGSVLPAGAATRSRAWANTARSEDREALGSRQQRTQLFQYPVLSPHGVTADLAAKGVSVVRACRTARSR